MSFLLAGAINPIHLSEGDNEEKCVHAGDAWLVLAEVVGAVPSWAGGLEIRASMSIGELDEQICR